MGIEFIQEKKEMGNMHILKERTFVNSDHSKVVDAATHKGGCFLLGGVGYAVPMAQAIALGLVQPEKKEQEPKEHAKKEKK